MKANSFTFGFFVSSIGRYGRVCWDGEQVTEVTKLLFDQCKIQFLHKLVYCVNISNILYVFYIIRFVFYLLQTSNPSRKCVCRVPVRLVVSFVAILTCFGFPLWIWFYHAHTHTDTHAHTGNQQHAVCDFLCVRFMLSICCSLANG